MLSVSIPLVCAFVGCQIPSEQQSQPFTQVRYTVSPASQITLPVQQRSTAQVCNGRECRWVFTPPKLRLPKLQREQVETQTLIYQPTSYSQVLVPAPQVQTIEYVPVITPSSPPPGELVVPSKQSAVSAPSIAPPKSNPPATDDATNPVLDELKRLNTSISSKLGAIDDRLTDLDRRLTRVERGESGDSVPPPPVIPDAPPASRKAVDKVSAKSTGNQQSRKS